MCFGRREGDVSTVWWMNLNCAHQWAECILNCIHDPLAGSVYTIVNTIVNTPSRVHCQCYQHPQALYRASNY